MHVDLDILVYAIIAAVLLGRLWAVLGTRGDDEPQRPNPFVPPPKPAPDDASFASSLAVSRMLPPPLPPASLAGGLAQVKTVLPAFDEKPFLQNARDSFTVVVGAYAAGDLNKVAEFLSPALLAHFQKTADARRAAGQSAQTRIAAIKESDPVAARAEANQAFITVKFVSDQENILRDAHGAVIGGEVGKTETVTDIWTFACDAQTLNAKWIVVETGG